MALMLRWTWQWWRKEPIHMGAGQDENLNRAVTFWCGNLAREYACTVIVQVIKCNRK
jgi:hypothetical protein